MNLKVVITFIASEEDWDITEVLNGRKPTESSAIEDIKQALLEDPLYVLKNSDIIIKEEKELL